MNDSIPLEMNPASKQCPICGCDDLLKFSAHASDSVCQSLVNIIECKSCAFAWQYPVARNTQDSINYFEAAYTDDGKTQSDYFNRDRKHAIAELELGFIKQLPVAGKALLDIGAGSGMFAELAAAEGWEVTALDPALDIERLVAGNPTVRAIKGSIDKLAEGDLFDAITLWDVIEHAEKPVELIMSSKSLLKPDAWLVIETGNYKSAGRVRAGLQHWIYQQDHRWYFSPESITQMLGHAGFSGFVFSKRVLRPGWNGSVGYAGPSQFGLLKQLVRQPLTLANTLSTHAGLEKARTWDMSGMEIFAVAARNRPLSQ